MRSLIIVLLIAIFAVFTMFVVDGSSEYQNSAQEQISGKLIITGSSTIAPLVSEIAKRFEAQHSDVRIDVQMGGSSRGVADVRQGISNIGMVSRNLKESEQDILAFPIALDGITMIVHKSNPIEELTNEQIAGIYTGEITNWKQVGGKDARITVVSKAEGRGTLDLFLNHFQLKNSAIKPQVIIGDNEQAIKTVSGNKNSIAFVSVGTAGYDSSIGIPIKLLPLNGVAASTENIQNGTFPMSRKLHLITNSPPEGLVKAFIEYANSNEVVDIIEEQYFVTKSK